MATTFCVSGAMLNKAGANVNTTIHNQSDEFINQAECLINVNSRFNFIDSYTTLNDDVKKLLEEIASNLSAIYAISYDMSGYTSRTEAETMLDVLRDSVMRNIATLKNVSDVQPFIEGA